MRRLRRSDLPLETLELACFLIGKILAHTSEQGLIAGRIVETEAYMPNDRASHAYRGETPRNGSMFGLRGTAYVYMSYGVHYCFNVASEERGTGAAVLVRALEPYLGIEAMRRNRRGRRDRDLARGPGRLTLALGIDASHNGRDLTKPGALWLGDDGMRPQRILAGPRIGITKETERPWRFWLPENRFVSAKRAL